MTRHFIEELDATPAVGRVGRPECVSLQISRDKLFELLRARHLCAADFTCLDCDSKDCVWRLILAACE